MKTRLTDHAEIDLPLICGAMYPCSNPELVAAASKAGGIGIVQPLALTYVHGLGFREGIRAIRSLTDKPIGLNALIEKSSKKYHEKMVEWVDIAIEEGIRFFVTSLGKPEWVVKKAHAVGGWVYHDVTEHKWALKALDSGVDGLIAVNNRAGGHAGELSSRQLFEDLSDLGLPMICAGGIGSEEDFTDAMNLGYDGVQMGTAFIATEECTAPRHYKEAIVRATEEDIVLTERMSGVPVSVINTPFIRRLGLKAGPIARRMLRGGRSKHLMRTIYALKSFWQLRRAYLDQSGKTDYWQAGKSVAGISRVESTSALISRYAKALEISEHNRPRLNCSINISSKPKRNSRE